MKMNYSYDEMKRAFECGRNFQLTGENDFQNLIEELNQELPQTNFITSVCLHEWDEGYHNVSKCKKCGKYSA